MAGVAMSGAASAADTEVTPRDFEEAVQRAASHTYGKKDAKAAKGDVRVAIHSVDLYAAATHTSPPLRGAFGADSAGATRWLISCVNEVEGQRIQNATEHRSGGVFVFPPGLVDGWVGNTWRPGVVAAAMVVQPVN